MRSATIYSLLAATLLIAGPTHAAPKSESKPAPKSAALATKTAYKADPLRALRCDFLLSQTDSSLTPPDELDLLTDANDGHIEHWSMAKAALVICGVHDPEQQKHYFAQLKAVEAECKKATADAHGAEARAKALGKFLLKGPMHAGYKTGQTDFVKLLDTGTFNCVSSAVMYNLMAPRIGVQVRAVTISGHVFSRALDFDIEPTSGNVYSLDDRTRRTLKNQSVVKSDFAPYQDQIFRETGNAGLLAEVYNNFAIRFSDEKRFPESISTYLKAACLDPGNPNVVYNLRVTFNKWIKFCKANHDDEKAANIKVLEDLLLRPYEETVLKVASNK